MTMPVVDETTPVLSPLDVASILPRLPTDVRITYLANYGLREKPSAPCFTQPTNTQLRISELFTFVLDQALCYTISLYAVLS